MKTTLRIAVADDEQRMREFIAESLRRLGHEVVAVADSGRRLIDVCHQHQPDLIITDIKMPDMDGIDAAREIYEDGAVPVILVSAFHNEELIERARKQHVLAYLVKPIKDVDLKPAISLATARFAEFEALRKEADDAKQALEDRKLIERAKGILMKRGGLDEQEAFHRLQKQAASKRIRLVEMARTMITADETLAGEC